MNMIQHTTPEDIIRMAWEKGNKKFASETEKGMREKGIALKFSCATQEILDRWITRDPDMLEMKRRVQLLQNEDDPVLILGESGTGKEMIARALHGYRRGVFVAINCTSLPDQLIESELFGHEKGSFTGAIDERIGKFEAAYNGTLFLDEIGDMPINMQTKLLRVLQEKVITRVGSNKEIKISCRVVAATNKSKEVLLGKKHFREDLYHRLAVFILQTKPLRERLGDIEEIVDSIGGEKLVNFFDKWKVEGGGQGLSNEEAYQTFFDLSGNVRSLQARVRRYQVFGE